MKAAITQLEISLAVLETNEPINRKEGHQAQANLEAQSAVEIKQALHILRAVDSVNDPTRPEFSFS